MSYLLEFREDKQPDGEKIMRVCRLHRADAVETLKSTEGIEYDLCKDCRKMVETILEGRKDEPHVLDNQKDPDSGRGRTSSKADSHQKKGA